MLKGFGKGGGWRAGGGGVVGKGRQISIKDEQREGEDSKVDIYLATVSS